MKVCPNCGAKCSDESAFCGECGTEVVQQPNDIAYQQQSQPQPQPNFNQNQQPYVRPTVPMYNPYDHTSEFDPRDISDNKVIAMLCYLMGTVGIIIALLAASSSKYAAFHVRQALKFTVVNILMSIVTILLCWTIIVPIVYLIMKIVLWVVKIICFFQICSGKAKEPAVIKGLGFLR